jgi:hypothetical protein
MVKLMRREFGLKRADALVLASVGSASTSPRS